MRIYASECRLNKRMYFCVNEFEVGVNDSIFSGNEQQKAYFFCVVMDRYIPRLDYFPPKEISVYWASFLTLYCNDSATTSTESSVTRWYFNGHLLKR